MSRKLKAITRKAPNQYSVHLEEQGSDRTLIFDFTVDSQNDIDVVQWSEDFPAYVEHNFGAVQELLEAVLRFHLARKVDYP
jgi:hypothetical protein